MFRPALGPTSPAKGGTRVSVAGYSGRSVKLITHLLPRLTRDAVPPLSSFLHDVHREYFAFTREKDELLYTQNSSLHILSWRCVTRNVRGRLDNYQRPKGARPAKADRSLELSLLVCWFGGYVSTGQGMAAGKQRITPIRAEGRLLRLVAVRAARGHKKTAT
jgi:hypothetical protein